MRIVCDLHTHTNCSDGIYSPDEIVDLAIKRKLKSIAITDHDTVAGISPAIGFSDHRIEVIPGIELSTEIEGHDVHILGYYVDYKNKMLLEVLNRCKEVRQARGLKIVNKLIQAGIQITFEQIQKCAGLGVIGRMHIAKVLYDNGQVGSIQDAFRTYLGDQSPFYEPKFKITPHDAFALIKKAGGICVWAHPGCEDLDSLMKQFVEDGLQGLEVWHPKHTNKNVRHYFELAKFYNLLATGGSDYHGHNNYTLGEYGLDEEHFTKFKLFSNK
ncbi:MAG: hypothetical protein A2381_13710 [Bdellovibrionales bacterium RIFOXYB1_FULL_37_110]|nr:MAG: hypothetical protein A2417_05345 [Bdellovibrionales bacterium RIFOXYC1_FULL_37_79]OFZ56917.1 MAG: hypothetical protein A2381_13710 [Bdellovibrionales bacterium RIFOXYB1_FULL_37_110]OFZ62004.1 MAG: hypothetical protein A2577_19180 [Bdellovibrionales bacterium RIFOXYD1_FULL_36_51]